MAEPVLGIDHPVIGVRDMKEARATYERLGFTVPPRGSHIEWGTGNWCIMFPHNYLELRGIIDPSRYTHNLDEFLAQREGLMGIAFGTNDAHSAYLALEDLDLHLVEPGLLTRNFELPDGNVKPRFRIVFIPEDELPGLMAPLLIEHLSPELIRLPEFLKHPNTTRGILSVTTVVGELDRSRSAYARFFGEDALREEDEILRVDAGRASFINVVTPTGLARLHGGLKLDPAPELPYLAAAVLEVDDLSRTRALLNENEVEIGPSEPGVVRVPQDQTCGVILEFAQG